MIAPNADLNYPPHYLFSIYGLDTPVGVTVSPDGDQIYISESGGDRLIRVFDREGNPLFAFAPPATSPGQRSPTYMATDALGHVYVADRIQHMIFQYTENGDYVDALIAPELSLSEYVSQHTGGLDHIDSIFAFFT